MAKKTPYRLMKDKMAVLVDKHFAEWHAEWQKQRDKVSDSHSLYCVCGKLATSLHEQHCRKFRAEVDRRTVSALSHLITVNADGSVSDKM